MRNAFVILLVAGFFGCASELGFSRNDARSQTDIGRGDVRDVGRGDSDLLDVGSTDTGSVDTGSADSGATDTGSTDSGSVDAGTMDSGSTDVGSVDSGANDSGSADVGSGDAGNCPLRVFLTSTSVYGDFGTQGVTGSAQGDALCQSHANSASLGGIWKAAILSPGETILGKIAGQGPWCNLKGERMFNSRATLLSEEAQHGWTLENGAPKPTTLPYKFAWTGANLDGTASSFNCGNWSQQSLTGRSAEPSAMGEAWHVSGTSFCNWTRVMMCFEQP